MLRDTIARGSQLTEEGVCAWKMNKHQHKTLDVLIQNINDIK
jgi:hypothetical protein